MKKTVQKLILISFILALIAAVTVLVYLKSLKTPEEATIKTTVLVAADTIPSRTLIDKKMIKEIQVSDNSIFSGNITDSSKIIGKYTKETIFKNEGFNSDKLLDKDENELSLKIANNNRAISISVTGDSGVSDLLKPGDYVDLVSYIAEKKDGSKVIRQDAAKIILQNIEVLAVDKQLNREEKVTEKASDNEKTLTNFLVTLSIPISDLEKIVLAESLGSIKIALRPMKDEKTTKTNGTTWESLYINSVEEEAKTDAVPTKENTSQSKSVQSSNTQKYTSYTVKYGDSLKEISKKFYGYQNKYTIIMKANNIQDQNLIITGQVIKIPILK